MDMQGGGTETGVGTLKCSVRFSWEVSGRDMTWLLLPGRLVDQDTIIQKVCAVVGQWLE